MPAKRKRADAVKQPENSVDSKTARLAGIAPHKFKPGQSGNPNGRPRKKTLTERMAEILEWDALDGIDIPAGGCVADVVAKSIVLNACLGKFPYTKELIDRLEGKVPDRVIDETPDASVERDRAELDSLLATLRERAGIAPPEDAGGAPVPGRDGDGGERG